MKLTEGWCVLASLPHAVLFTCRLPKFLWIHSSAALLCVVVVKIQCEQILATMHIRLYCHNKFCFVPQPFWGWNGDLGTLENLWLIQNAMLLHPLETNSCLVNIKAKFVLECVVGLFSLGKMCALHCCIPKIFLYDVFFRSQQCLISVPWSNLPYSLVLM